MIVGSSTHRCTFGLYPKPVRFHARRLTVVKSFGSYGNGGGNGGRDDYGNGGNGGDDNSDGNGRLGWMILALGAQALAGPAIAAKKKEEPPPPQDPWDWFPPFLTAISVSGLLGFACGAALKFVGRPLAITIGCLFIAGQLMIYAGAININWTIIEKRLDITGDGKFNEDDMMVITNNFLRVLVQGVPAGTGFGCGFLLGMALG